MAAMRTMSSSHRRTLRRGSRCKGSQRLAQLTWPVVANGECTRPALRIMSVLSCTITKLICWADCQLLPSARSC